jgi:ubiquinone/menaquinone biosynthesis C-methylase UbiE
MNYDNMLTLKKRLGSHVAGSLLDIAVGRGDFLKFVLSSFHSWKRAAGIDTDPETLYVARQSLEGSSVILVNGSALAMPFIGAYFDTITMSNALHHIEDLDSLFRETFRVCKPDGLFLINEMLNENHSRLQEPYMLYHRFISEVDNQMGRYHHEPFSLKELLAMVKTSGFTTLDYFIHEEVTGDCLNEEEIEAMSERMRRKVLQLKGSDYYYFYENKIGEIINRLSNAGVHKPRHITFMLRPA